jgi:hypothetical protein
MARSRLKAKGRADFGSYVAMLHTVLESPEWAALTAFEVKLLLDVYGQFNGKNNGTLSAAWTLMKPRGWNSQDTLNRALRGLLDKGFLLKTRQGGKHRCSFFAVTWREVHECDGKHDMRPTKTAPGTWKNKTVLQEAEHIATADGAISYTQRTN